MTYTEWLRRQTKVYTRALKEWPDDRCNALAESFLYTHNTLHLTYEDATLVAFLDTCPLESFELQEVTAPS